MDAAAAAAADSLDADYSAAGVDSLGVDHNTLGGVRLGNTNLSLAVDGHGHSHRHIDLLADGPTSWIVILALGIY